MKRKHPPGGEAGRVLAAGDLCYVVRWPMDEGVLSWVGLRWIRLLDDLPVAGNGGVGIWWLEPFERLREPEWLRICSVRFRVDRVRPIRLM